jgi:hypothetical protein
MAEEKKPKIDLKARLGKGAGTPPPPVAGIPVPGAVPAAGGGGGMPQSSPHAGGGGGGGGLPVPPGIPVGPPPAFGKAAGPALDPSNPLAVAATPYRAPQAQSARPAAPPQPQRIEVDEMAVQEARKGARKQGLVAGLVAAVVLGAIGYIAGGAIETNKGRQRSVADAKALAADVGKSKEQLKSIADKVEAGKNSLLKEKKFPADLAKELSSINVDFDGTKLAGVRFSGFPQDTTSGLIEYITLVQTMNDRKGAITGLLQRLQKPITEQLTAGQKTTINYVVFFGKQDPSRNPFALLAPLTKPIEAANAGAIQLPAEFTATDPVSRANISAPKYTKGDLDKPSAVYVLQKSIDAACPSETSGAIAQLGSQLAKVITDIRGEAGAAGSEMVQEGKVGLLERAEKLMTGLNKVQ